MGEGIGPCGKGGGVWDLKGEALGSGGMGRVGKGMGCELAEGGGSERHL